MDYSLVSRRKRLLDGRSVAVAMLVLIVGVGLGFAGGDSYGHDTARATPPTTRATPTQTKTKTWNPTSPEGRQQLLSCLVGKNVPYPNPNTADFKRPPPGVDDATLNAALGVCYRELVANGGKQTP